MREIVRFTVPVDVNEAAQNKRMHWRKRANVVAAHRRAANAIWMKAGKPTAAESEWPVTVNAIIRRGRAIDEWNAPGCLKHVIDGAFVKAFTPDDDARFVLMGTVTQEIGKQWRKAPEVEIIVMTGGKDDSENN